MNIESYKKMRAELNLSEPQFRDLCLKCFHPGENCYCTHVKTLKPDIKFIILIHPIERRRRIATGRMAHLCLENSELITTHEHRGHDYSGCHRVNEILANPAYHSTLLYPGAQATNLSEISLAARKSIRPPHRQLVVFVVDGTWHTARKTVFHSPNLKALPRICFSPGRPSQFRVRKQPNANCFSTIEAIHYTLEIMADRAATVGEHNQLLAVFDAMVERQLQYVEKNKVSRHRRRARAA